MSDSFDLKVNQIALGQRISVKTDTTSTQVIEDTLNALTSVQGDPYAILQALFGDDDTKVQIGYDASSKWLIGGSLKISSMTLDLLFDDKSFYGVLIKFDESDDDGDEGEGGEGNGFEHMLYDTPGEGGVLEAVYMVLFWGIVNGE